MKKDGTIHLVYQRQYYDEEDRDYFFINFTTPLKYFDKCWKSKK